MRAIDADALTASLKKSEDRCHDWIQECINIKDDVTQRLAEQSLLTFNECCLRIKKMPTIEPQRMKGRWETDAYGAMDDGEYLVTRCNVCGTVYEYGHDDRYCGFCGAAMEAQNETS